MLSKMRENMKNEKGFTLVELMVVIAILGILAAIAVPRLNNSSATARGAKIVADLRTIDSAVMIAVANGQTIPATNIDVLATDNSAFAAAVRSNLASVPAPPTGLATTPTTPGGRTVANGTVYGIQGTTGRAIISVGGTAFTAETF